MPSFSSREMQKLWRYAVATDFHPLSSNSNCDTAPVGNTTKTKLLGTESAFYPFSPALPERSGQSAYGHEPSVNDGCTKLALPVGHDIHIYDLSGAINANTPLAPTVLRGHLADVHLVRFAPHSRNRLISAARDSNSEDEETQEIICWDLDAEVKSTRKPLENDVIEEAAKVAMQTALAHISGSVSTSTSPEGYQISEDDRTSLRTIIHEALRLYDTKGLLPPNRRIRGRLSTSFQSPIFSNDGTRFVYFPGDRGSSNDDSQWDICLASFPTDSATPEIVTLRGHTDAIMYRAFSPDDELLVSASWDKTFRASRSISCPDGKEIVGTCGDGTTYLWDVATGDEVWRYTPVHPVWCRLIDWSQPGPLAGSRGLIAIGADEYGRVMLFTPDLPRAGEAKQPLQEYRMSTEKVDAPPEIKEMAGRFLATAFIRFLAGTDERQGLKLAYGTYTEGGVEVYDFEKGRKWRIAMRPESDEGTEQERPQGSSRWFYLPRSDQVLVLGEDGIRLFDLD